MWPKRLNLFEEVPYKTCNKVPILYIENVFVQDRPHELHTAYNSSKGLRCNL